METAVDDEDHNGASALTEAGPMLEKSEMVIVPEVKGDMPSDTIHACWIAQRRSMREFSTRSRKLRLVFHTSAHSICRTCSAMAQFVSP